MILTWAHDIYAWFGMESWSEPNRTELNAKGTIISYRQTSESNAINDGDNVIETEYIVHFQFKNIKWGFISVRDVVIDSADFYSPEIYTQLCCACIWIHCADLINKKKNSMKCVSYQ